MFGQLLISVNNFLNFSLDLLNKHFVWWIIFKPKQKDLLDSVPETFWNNVKELFGVLEVQSFLKVILKVVIRKVFRHSTPGELVAVQEVDHYIDGRLEVISPALGVAAATVSRCK